MQSLVMIYSATLNLVKNLRILRHHGETLGMQLVDSGALIKH
jgi:hypothetical protein